ncbi:MAG: hypothetical protein F6J97_25650 [Leptolyngbya sp. SIO4C1]|nr:hypothetical protein [Leptolyngbya sp. SIO4C1]
MPFEAEQAAQTDRAEDRERLAEVVAVSEKYTKPAVSESVPTSVSVSSDRE